MPGERTTLGALLALLLLPAACAARFPVDGERALGRVVHQVEAGPGVPGHRAIRDWLAGELKRLGGAVEVQEASDSSLGRRLELSNLIARFGPRSGRRIALLA